MMSDEQLQIRVWPTDRWKVFFQLLSADGEWRCRGDVGWLFVPEIDAGDGKRPFVDCSSKTERRYVTVTQLVEANLSSVHWICQWQHGWCTMTGNLVPCR